MGRPKVPTKLKLLRGNPGKRPLPKNEPEPKGGKPQCPDFLSDAGKAEWRRISKKLHDCGLLTSVDGQALATYCQSWEVWVDAHEKMRDTGAVITAKNGVPMLNPWFRVAQGAFNEMRDMLREFGMTPQSRSKISVKKPERDLDPMEEVLLGKPRLQ